MIVAKAGELSDEGKIRKVAERNMDYVLREVGAVLNRIRKPKKEIIAFLPKSKRRSSCCGVFFLARFFEISAKKRKNTIYKKTLT